MNEMIVCARLVMRKCFVYQISTEPSRWPKKRENVHISQKTKLFLFSSLTSIDAWGRCLTPKHHFFSTSSQTIGQNIGLPLITRHSQRSLPVFVKAQRPLFFKNSSSIRGSSNFLSAARERFSGRGSMYKNPIVGCQSQTKEINALLKWCMHSCWEPNANVMNT